MSRWFALALILTCSSSSVAAEPGAKPSAAQIEYFENKVRPLLAEHCYSCHGPKKQNAGLRLDNAAGLKAGADNGPVVVPGDPLKSRLMISVRREGDYAMPPKGALPPAAVAVLAEWVKTGAVFPDTQGAVRSVEARDHWAFQPVKLPPVPAIRTSDQIRNPIDSFVLAQLRDSALSQAPIADRRSLIRRAYFDLIGLPPTVAQVEAFEKDSNPLAWERLIDELLASPQYGERWGRLWLDLARYADTKGYVFNQDRNYPYAYTYRDYVVRSFNDDKPYDRFVIEQLAADKLQLGEDTRPLAALGFLTLGRRFLGNTHDIIDDRIDVVTRGLMGLTVGCARCHDHKYDPVPTADYYSLYGVFASTKEPEELPLIGKTERTPQVIAFEKEMEKREAEYEAEITKRHNNAIAKLKDKDAIADYLRAVLDSKGKPNDQLLALLRERDLNRFVFDRWKAYLEKEIKANSPVFKPLIVISAIPERSFASDMAKQISAWEMDSKRAVNPIVLKAMADLKPQTPRAAVEAIAYTIAALPPDKTTTPEQAELFAWNKSSGPLDIPTSDYDKFQNRADRNALAAIKKKLDAFKASSPFAPPRAHVLNDNPAPFQPYIFLRGNQGNRGAQVPRQAPSITAPQRKPFTQGSGRLELAQSIVSPDNPLTARVLVNRVWSGHFGQGLVRTPSDFGTRSDPPTQPELLDWLAVQLVREGWSLKKLHKLIMTSATYQQSSVVSADAFRTDVENKLLSHQNRRRLDFESLRDSFLLVSGKLDLTAGGKPVDLFKAPFSTRRSIYGLIDRTNFPGTMRVFDVANPDQHSPQRFQTTAPQQALFLMNSPFVTEQAIALAARSDVSNAKSNAAKVKALYQMVLARNPTRDELQLAEAFVADNSAKTSFGKWQQLAQILLLSNEFAFVD